MSIPRTTALNSTPHRCLSQDLKDMKLSPIGSRTVVTKSPRKTIPEMHKIAGKKASLYAKDFDKNSTLRLKMRQVDELRWSDLDVGELLGKGAFCIVRKVRLKDKGKRSPTQVAGQDDSEASLNTAEIFNDSSVFNESSVSQDAEIQDRALSEVGGSSSFALKCIDPQHLKAERNFSDCAIDLVMEAKILACLSHPNIIKLHAVTGGSVSRAFMRRKGYFLILDRLNGSLEDRIRTWADEELSMSNVERVVRRGDRLKSVILGVIRGMRYLHKNNVIYRDLKPSNIGFTHSGEVKLFDFGLAREVRDPSRRLTGYTGSARYMAPEVARSDFYGFPADVYSFAILLWEVCSLEKPFAGMSKQEHLEMVVGAQLRPKISAVMASSGLKQLLQSSWNDDPRRRPTFGGILVRVRSEIDLRDAPHRSFESDRSRLRQHRGESIDNKLSMSLPSAFDKAVALEGDASP